MVVNEQQIWTREDCLKAIEQCYELHQQQSVHKKEYEKWAAERAVPQIEDLRQQFGSWSEARHAAGKGHTQGRLPDSTFEEADNALRTAKQLWGDRPMRIQDYEQVMENRPEYVGVWVIKNYFGNWLRACHRHEIIPGVEYKLSKDDQLLEAVGKVCQEEGRPLSMREFDRVRPQGTPLAKSLSRLWGGWHQVLAETGVWSSEELADELTAQLGRRYSSAS
jgi:hypothetical protein